MVIHKGIRIHQYLDDWLVRARSHQTCLQYTQELAEICQKLGWMVNFEKSELEPKQVFAHTGPVTLTEPSTENTGTYVPTSLPGPAFHIPDQGTKLSQNIIQGSNYHTL